MADHQQHAGLLAGFDHPIRGGEVRGDRLFHEDMLAGRGGLQRDRFVHLRGQADVDHVDVRIGEEFVDGLVGRHLGQIHLTSGRTEVALQAGPVAGPFFGVAAGDRGDLAAAELLGRREVRVPHEAQADDADTDHAGLQNRQCVDGSVWTDRRWGDGGAGRRTARPSGSAGRGGIATASGGVPSPTHCRGRRNVLNCLRIGTDLPDARVPDARVPDARLPGARGRSAGSTHDAEAVRPRRHRDPGAARVRRRRLAAERHGTPPVSLPDASLPTATGPRSC